MKNKKAVSTVIVTVLLILLVIAAVGILWVVIQRFVTTGTEDLGSATDCLETDLEISSYDATSVTVKRISGNAEIAEIKVLVEGSATTRTIANTETFGIGETKKVDVAVVNTNTIEVAAVIGTTTCTVADTKTAEGLAA